MSELNGPGEDAERLNAVLEQLTVRLATAEREETIGRVTDQLHQISDINQRANAFWQKHGGTLQDLLAQSKAFAVERERAAYLLADARRQAWSKYEDDPRIAAGVNGVSLTDEAKTWRNAIKNARAPE